MAAARIIPQANRGSGLEALLELQHGQYIARQRAFLWHVAAPTTVVRRGGEIVGAFHKGQATADYLGVICADGQGVAAEAKEERGKRFKWSRIQPQQRVCLDAYEDAGGIAALVLWWTVCGGVWAIPWADARALIKSGGASIPWAPASEWLVAGTGPCDWLARWAGDAR